MDKVYVDKGVKAYFMNIYQYLGINLLLAGGVSYAIASSATLMNLIFGSPLYYVLLFAPLGIAFYLSSRLNQLSIQKIQVLYWLYGATIGASLSIIFVAYSMDSIFRCFFMAAGIFIAAALYGRFTSKDLSSVRSVLMVGLFGVIGVSIVNLFMQSSAMQYFISIATILVFTGFIAYNMQQLLAIYFTRQSEEAIEKISIIGALQLFISVINIFLALLQLFGDRRRK